MPNDPRIPSTDLQAASSDPATRMRSRSAGQARVGAIALGAVGVAAIVGGYLYQKDRTDRLHREEQIVYAGNEITDAIASYYGAAPNGVLELPRELADLTDDTRTGRHVQHLSALPVDPITGQRDWIAVRNDEGRVVGVHSASPRSTVGLPAFASARVIGTHYLEWIFSFDPPPSLKAASALASSGPGAPVASRPAHSKPPAAGQPSAAAAGTSKSASRSVAAGRALPQDPAKAATVADKRGAASAPERERAVADAPAAPLARSDKEAVEPAAATEPKLQLAKRIDPPEKYAGQRLETLIGKSDPHAKPLESLPPLVGSQGQLLAGNAATKPGQSASEYDPLRYTVKFVFEGTTLGPNGRAVVESLANAPSPPDHLELLGQADGSGPRWINERIAQMRAESVRHALVRAGVSATTIHVRPVVIHNDAQSLEEQADARRVDIDLFIKNGKPSPDS